MSSSAPIPAPAGRWLAAVALGALVVGLAAPSAQAAAGKRTRRTKTAVSAPQGGLSASERKAVDFMRARLEHQHPGYRVEARLAPSQMWRTRLPISGRPPIKVYATLTRDRANPTQKGLRGAVKRLFRRLRPERKAVWYVDVKQARGRKQRVEEVGYDSMTLLARLRRSLPLGSWVRDVFSSGRGLSGLTVGLSGIAGGTVATGGLTSAALVVGGVAWGFDLIRRGIKKRDDLRTAALNDAAGWAKRELRGSHKPSAAEVWRRYRVKLRADNWAASAGTMESFLTRLAVDHGL